MQDTNIKEYKIRIINNEIPDLNIAQRPTAKIISHSPTP